MEMEYRKTEYDLIKSEYMTKDEIVQRYGRISFAYEKENTDNDTYLVIAISGDDAPFLKGRLMLDNIEFLGVENSIDEIIMGEVL